MRRVSVHTMSLPHLLNTCIYINIMLNTMGMQLCRDEPVYTPAPLNNAGAREAETRPPPPQS